MNEGERHWGVPWWIRCVCMDWFCLICECHVHECACPDVEEIMDPDGPDMVVIL